MTEYSQGLGVTTRPFFLGWALPRQARGKWAGCLGLILLALCRFGAARAQERGVKPVMGLMELYGTSALILYGEEDKFSADVLLTALQADLKGLKLVPAQGQKAPKDDLVIYVGSFKSNPLAQQVFKSLGYSIKWEAMTEGSFFLKTFRKSGRTTVFAIGKDRIGTLYAVHELKGYFTVNMGRVLLNELNIVERAHLKYRWFRDWDHRTDWDLADSATHASSEETQYSVPSKYPNSSEAYLRDLKKTIDFMSEHRLNGLILWGFLRQSHGGMAAAQEICNYAQERGVRILPGVGMGGHGGFFYEGENPFNLDNWIKAHPELRSVDLKGDFRDHTLCPEKIENRNWYREALQWIYKNFKIGGLSLEIGDFFVCYCNDCKKARQAMGGKDPDYYKDMSRAISFVAEEAHKLDPNSWISYNTYTGFDFDSIQNPPYWARSSLKVNAPFPPEFTRVISDSTICEWSLTEMFRKNLWPSPFKAPSAHNIGSLQWGNASSKTSDQLFFKRIQEITHHVISSNLEGLIVYGEESPERPNIELNYLTFAQFSFNPATDPEDFSRRVISRLYGGEDAAKKMLKILDLLENEQGMTLQNREEALKLARQAQESADRGGKPHWMKFIQYLEELKIS
jgi:hypothetical protein